MKPKSISGVLAESTKSSSSGQRGRSISHPRFSLDQALNMAKKMLDMGARHCDQDKVAQALQYSNSNNGSYKTLRATAVQFGFVKSEGSSLSLTDEWINVLSSDDELLQRYALMRAMNQPDLYQQLISEYRRRQLPSADKLARELYVKTEYGILKDAAKTAAEVFLKSAAFAGLVDEKGYLLSPDEVTSETAIASDDSSSLPSVPVSLAVQRASNSALLLETEGHSQTLIALPKDLDRIEVRLSNGQRAFLFVPVPLPFGERERLKRYIDLLLEEPPAVSQSGSATQSSA